MLHYSVSGSHFLSILTGLASCIASRFCGPDTSSRLKRCCWWQ